jgi:hypothetical protein
MKIKNATIEFSNGSAIVKYPITPLILLEIKKNSLFNFQEMLFEDNLPSFFQKGNISISSESTNAAGFKDNEEFDIDPSQWQILGIEADDRLYPTFFLLRKEGKLPGSLKKAMLDFAVSRSTKSENLSKETEGQIKEVLSDILDLGADGEINEGQLENVVGKFISTIESKNQQTNLSTVIEKFLADNNIPVDNENDCYYYTVNFKEYNWNVELGFSADKLDIIMYSSVSLKTIENITDLILVDINELNQVIDKGHYEIDVDEQILYFKNEATINFLLFEVQLKKLVEESYAAMKVILPVLLKKYPDNISFFV